MTYLSRNILKQRRGIKFSILEVFKVIYTTTTDEGVKNGAQSLRNIF